MGILRQVGAFGISLAVFLASLFGVILVFNQCLGTSDGQPVLEKSQAPKPIGTPSALTSNDSEPESTPIPTAAPSSTFTPIAATATLTRTASPSTPTAVLPSPTMISTATPEIPTPNPTPASPAPSNFSGNWRVVDVVEEGSGAGQTFTFDVTLNQVGPRLSGGNGGFVIQGTVDGNAASVSFVQQDLGITGTISWRLLNAGLGTGMFSTSVPNSGSSQLIRR
jgi:hypothetical protein